MKPKLIIAANRLPVSAVKINQRIIFKPSPGGLASALNPVLKGGDGVWFGFYSVNRADSKKQVPVLNLRKKLKPIVVDDQLFDRYYKNFANGSLWPVLHGFKPKRIYKSRDWQATLDINQEFAEEIATLAKPKDLIWVHDFHLMMLPKFLRQLGLQNKIGFFLHTPAPAADLFKKLPCHRELLESLAATDLLGVQTEADLNRLKSCYSRLVKADMPNIRYFPIGIDYTKYRLSSKRPTVLYHIKKLPNTIDNRTVIFSASRLDYTKGLVEQLKAIERILRGGIKPKGILYKLVVMPSRENMAEYQQTKRRIEMLVNKINTEFGSNGWKPIDYQYKGMDFAEIAAWYSVADIMLVTPLIDGMNLIAKEYVAVKPTNNGALILSKYAGAAQQLKQALLVNPTDPKDIAQAIIKAVEMPARERRQRFAAMRRNVRNENVFLWAKQFRQELSKRRSRETSRVKTPVTEIELGLAAEQAGA